MKTGDAGNKKEEDSSGFQSGKGAVRLCHEIYFGNAGQNKKDQIKSDNRPLVF